MKGVDTSINSSVRHHKHITNHSTLIIEWDWLGTASCSSIFSASPPATASLEWPDGSCCGRCFNAKPIRGAVRMSSLPKEHRKNKWAHYRFARLCNHQWHGGQYLFCDPSIAIHGLVQSGRPFGSWLGDYLHERKFRRDLRSNFFKLKVPSSNTSSRADPSLGYNAWKRSKMESTLGAAEHCTWPWCRGSSHLGTFECSQLHDNSSKVFRFYMFRKVQTNKEKLEAKVGSPSLSMQKVPCKVHQPRVAANRPIWP